MIKLRMNMRLLRGTEHVVRVKTFSEKLQKKRFAAKDSLRVII